jgi:hypothetical protein
MATYDTVGVSGVVFGATSVTTASFTVTSSSDRGVALALYHHSNTSTNFSASSNSIAGSLVSGTDTGTARSARSMIFGVPAASAGAQTATVSWTTGSDAYLAALSYSDVDQTTPFNNGASGNGATGAPRVTPTAGSNAGDRSIGAYSATGGGGNVQTPRLFHITGTGLNWDGTDGAAGATHGCDDYFFTWVASGVNVKTKESAGTIHGQRVIGGGCGMRVIG